MSEFIIYEQPLNERTRTLLRLEFLFKQLKAVLCGDLESDNRNVIQTLLAILSVFERNNLKQEILKELERLSLNLSALESVDGVDTDALEQLLSELDIIIDLFYEIKGSIGQILRENHFLYAIRQRSMIAGGTCDFDLPAYHYWLHHTASDVRKEQLRKWVSQFDHVQAAINVTLRLIRSGSNFVERISIEGFYQQSLDSNRSNQLIRVQVEKDALYYPEISGGKHRFTVRFIYFSLNEQSTKQVDGNVDFLLSCCAM